MHFSEYKAKILKSSTVYCTFSLIENKHEVRDLTIESVIFVMSLFEVPASFLLNSFICLKDYLIFVILAKVKLNLEHKCTARYLIGDHGSRLGR